MSTAKIAKKQILAAKTSVLRSLNNEAALKLELSLFFQKLQDNILKELEEYYNPDFMFQGQVDLILSPIFESQQEYYNILRKYNHKEYLLGRSTGKRLVKLARKNTVYSDKAEESSPMSPIMDKDKLFATNDWSEQRLLNQSFTASESTMNRIDKDINKILADGYNDGWGINKVRDKIVKRFGQLKDWEATRIARTEIHNAHNMGTMNIYQEMNIGYTQWISAHDNRTRDTHVEIDREIIPLGGTYTNGLQFPGDTKGPISEWINCRCANAPFIIPDGYAAPPGMAQFKESDLVKIDVSPIEDIISQSDSNDSRIMELEKQKEELEAIVSKWKARGNPIAETFESKLRDVEFELEKLKKPAVKIVEDPLKPKVDVGSILSDVLDEFGLNGKTKPKSKPKKKSKPKNTKSQKVITKTLKEQLRGELPSDFSDETIEYIVGRVKKRGKVKSEYGQIFDYKTGKTHSPEFRGGRNSVNIKTEDWIKPVKEMTMDEQLDALSNPQKYKKSFIDNSKHLATQHNHPSDGAHAPSGADFYTLLVHEWEDYGLQISEHEVWCIERKGKINMFDAKDVELKCDKLFKKAKRTATTILRKEFDDLDGNARVEKHMELINEQYGAELLKYFKSQPHGIKLTQVKV